MLTAALDALAEGANTLDGAQSPQPNTTDMMTNSLANVTQISVQLAHTMDTVAGTTMEHAFTVPSIPVISRTEVYLQITLLAVCALIGLVFNLLTVLSVLLYKHMQTNLNVLFANLALKDILTCTFYIPFHVAGYGAQRWVLDNNLCRFLGFMSMLGFLSGLVTHTLITLSQYYYGTRSYVTYRGKFSSCHMTLYMVMSWLLPTLLMGLYYVTDNIEFSFSFVYHTCTIQANNPASTIITIALVIVACYIIICYSYFQLYARIDIRVQPLGVESAISEEYVQMCKTMALVFITFTVSWLVSSVVYAADRHYVHFQPAVHRVTFQLLEYQAIVTPVILFVREPVFQESYQRLICGKLIFSCNCYKYYASSSTTSSSIVGESHLNVHSVNLQVPHPDGSREPSSSGSSANTAWPALTRKRGRNSLQMENIFYVDCDDARAHSQATSISCDDGLF